MAAKRQNAFYNRYLDIIDAKIESDYMQRALDKGAPPEDTAGLFCPLPKSIQGENRRRIARVAADLQFVETATSTTQGKPIDAFPNNSSKDISVIRFLFEELKSFLQVRIKRAEKPLRYIASIARSRAFIRLAVVGVVIFAVWTGGNALMKSIRAHKQAVVVAPALLPSPPSAATAAVAPVQSQEAPPADAPATEAKSTPAPVNPNVVAQVISTPQASPDNDQPVEQIKSAAIIEADKIAKFKQDCESILADNTNRIAGLSRSHRTALTKQNGEIQIIANSFIDAHGNYLNFVQTTLPVIGAKPLYEQQSILQRVKTKFSAMETDRQEVYRDFDALNSEITNAPAKSKFHFFK